MALSIGNVSSSNKSAFIQMPSTATYPNIESYTANNKRIYIFTQSWTNGSAYIDIPFTVYSRSVSVEYLMIGGGGGGGTGVLRQGGCGGGAGGLISSTATLTTGDYVARVGMGGYPGSAGSNTVLRNANGSALLTAYGGGRGAGVSAIDVLLYGATSGGCGGGAYRTFSGTTPVSNAGLGSAGQGYNGGDGISYTSLGTPSSWAQGGGGGGAGGAGTGSIGGNWIESSITGKSVIYGIGGDGESGKFGVATAVYETPEIGSGGGANSIGGSGMIVLSINL